MVVRRGNNKSLTALGLHTAALLTPNLGEVCVISKSEDEELKMLAC